MKRYLLLSALAASLPLGAAIIKSPDSRLVVVTEVRDGHPLYSVTYDGKQIISPAPLGFRADIGDFSQAMKSTGSTAGSVEKCYEQDRVKKSHIHYHANTLTEDFINANGSKMQIEWQVADNDISFRYLIPRKGDTGSARILDEATSFAFPAGTTTFLTPQSDAMIGWKRTKPSYEEKYNADAPVGEPSLYGHGYTFPALFHIGDAGWALVSETGVDGKYCGSRLGDAVDGVYKLEYPMAEENNGNGSREPGISLPGATPWRTITVGDGLAPIVETTAPWNVLEPLYEGHTAKPGKGTWSWILWQDDSINPDDQRKFVDLAAEMGYQHILVDCGWDVNIGRDGMRELAEYARSKGVGLIVWYSSSGWWNDITQSPTDIMSRPIPRKQELKWLKSLGVDKIKVDFFGGDKQETMRLYEDILSDAADYGVDVIFHGCTLPRGWERLYPNYVGSEAVLASENLVFGQQFCDEEAFNATLHPFIRNAVGSMEYGGTVLNHRLNRNNDGGSTRRTGDAFQLATSVLFQNAVQNFALSPSNLTDAPAEAISFMKDVPTVWNDTRFLDGYPGKYVLIARRCGDRWYIAGVNATDKALKLTVDLEKLGVAGEAVEYRDNDKLQLATSLRKLKKPQKTTVKIEPNGGVVLVAPAK